MKARDIMTPGPCCCAPTASIGTVARLMRDNDCGVIPVVDANGCAIGIVTDRDLAIRGVGDGRSADSPVSEVMSATPCSCSADDDIAVVERVMMDHQVRRVPIADADGRCIGIVAQADLARSALDGGAVTDREVARVVEKISVPADQHAMRAVSDGLEQTF
jgi:CBS domain-containing protein